MSRAQISSLIVVLGLAAITAGVFGLIGLWWSLIAGGTLCAGYALFGIDVDEPQRKERAKK